MPTQVSTVTQPIETALTDIGPFCRKIRCCGGSPCRNCSRSQRECEYAPVPEEVNRATREKKAIAKASKGPTPHFSSPLPAPYSPYFVDTPVFDVPYVSGLPMEATPMRPNMAHRRSVSVPNFEATSWSSPPPAPSMSSPAIFENAQWMYNGWSTGPPIPVTTQHIPSSSTYPSVLENTADYPMMMPQFTPPDSRSTSTPDVSSSWSTPNLHLRVPPPGCFTSSSLSPQTPVSSIYYTPHPTPPVYQETAGFFTTHYAQQQQISTSPTLAPEMALPSKDLIGLGIGMHDGEDVHIPYSDDYLVPQY